MGSRANSSVWKNSMNWGCTRLLYSRLCRTRWARCCRWRSACDWPMLCLHNTDENSPALPPLVLSRFLLWFVSGPHGGSWRSIRLRDEIMMWLHEVWVWKLSVWGMNLWGVNYRWGWIEVSITVEGELTIKGIYVIIRWGMNHLYHYKFVWRTCFSKSSVEGRVI